MLLFPKSRDAGFEIPDNAQWAWLLMWYASGRLRYVTTRPDFSLTCAETGHDPSLEPGLMGEVQAPASSIEIAPEPSYSPPSGASVSVSLTDLSFSPSVILENTPAELSLIRNGIDIAERVVCARGFMRSIAWSEDGETVSGQIVSDPMSDAGKAPSRRVTYDTWPDFVDPNPRIQLYFDGEAVGDGDTETWYDQQNAQLQSWRGALYPVWYGSGQVTRVKGIPCDKVFVPIGAFTDEITYIIRDGHAPYGAQLVVAELYDNDSKTWESLDQDVNTCTLENEYDNAGNPVTIVRIVRPHLEEAGGIVAADGSSQLYFTVVWSATHDDTLAASLMRLLSDYADLSGPIDEDGFKVLSREYPDLRFDLQINAEAAPMSLVTDRVFRQLATTIINRFGALSAWTIPSALTADGTGIGETDIVRILSPPSETGVDTLVNTLSIKWGRNPQSGGDGTWFSASVDGSGPLRNDDGVTVRQKIEDTPATMQSRYAYGARALELSCPDLVSQTDVEGVAARIVRFFSHPAFEISYQLKPRFNAMLPGDIVSVTDDAWGLSSAPFIVKAVSPSVEGPSVTLWGGREIR